MVRVTKDGNGPCNPLPISFRVATLQACCSCIFKLNWEQLDSCVWISALKETFWEVVCILLWSSIFVPKDELLVSWTWTLNLVPTPETHQCSIHHGTSQSSSSFRIVEVCPNIRNVGTRQVLGTYALPRVILGDVLLWLSWRQNSREEWV